MLKAQAGLGHIIGPLAAILAGQPGQLLGIITLINPGSPNGIQPFTNVDLGIRVGIGTRGIINRQRWVILELSVRQWGRMLLDFPHGDTNVRARSRDIDLS